MPLQKRLSLKTTQNNRIHFYNRDMSQAKEDVAVTYIIHLVNQLLAVCMSSNPQPQTTTTKREFMCKTRIAQLITGIAVEIEPIKKKKLNYRF